MSRGPISSTLHSTGLNPNYHFIDGGTAGTPMESRAAVADDNQ